ncbi:MAG: hypothetical protein JWS10_4273 [Cypionkella sp.]|nr:hypothetical protein [Cypionkella sp.]
MTPDLPNLSQEALRPPQFEGSPPRILLLYGSLRARSYSRLRLWRQNAFCASSAATRGSFTQTACRCRTTPGRTIPRSRNCAS